MFVVPSYVTISPYIAILQSLPEFLYYLQLYEQAMSAYKYVETNKNSINRYKSISVIISSKNYITTSIQSKYCINKMDLMLHGI